MKNKTLKSIIASLLSVAMLMSFVACGGSGSGEDKKNNSAGASASDGADANGSTNSDGEKNIEKGQVGSYITFGTYEQDGDTSNGAEDIEWLVLDVEDGKTLVISKYELDCKPYNEVDEGVTWETCTLRTWLNNYFYDTAFSDSDKNKVCLTNVVAEKNPNYDTEAGNNTQDKVFVLSISEAEKYFSSDDERKCKPTQYAINNGAWFNKDPSDSDYGNCWWWLRSPGYDLSITSGVGGDGDIEDYYNRNDVEYNCNAVRPAMWITVG